MAQVPYEKVPTVSPDSTPIPKVHEEAPGAAFGLNIANATEGFGRQLGTSGEQVVNTALEIKRLENESWAKDADVDVMIKLGSAAEKFKEKEGLDAKAGLNNFNEEVKGIRQEALDRAPSPNARRMLDNSIARRVGFAIVDAGAHAGNQAKAAADRASTARQGAASDAADPTNPAQYDFNLRTVEAETRARGRQRGDSQDTIERNVDVAKSDTVLKGISKLAPNDPPAAQKFLDQNEGNLKPNDLQQAKTIVNRNMVAHQTRIDAQEVLAGKAGDGPVFNPKDGPGQDSKILEAAEKVADEKGKDNPDYRDALMRRVKEGLVLGHAAYTDTQNGNRMAVEKFVRGNSPQEKITSIDGVIGPNAPKEIRDQYYSLSPENQKKIDNFILKENKQVPYTSERQQRFHTLWGLSVKDPAEFSKVSLINEDLPAGKIDDLMKRQASIVGKTVDDTKISRYLSQANPILRNVGIVPGKPESPESQQYLHFIGSLDQRVKDFETDHGKPPTPKDVREITQDLIQNIVTGTKWFGLRNQTQKAFEVEVPEERKAGIVQAIKESGKIKQGEEPTEEQVRDAWIKINRATGAFKKPQ